MRSWEIARPNLARAMDRSSRMVRSTGPQPYVATRSKEKKSRRHQSCRSESGPRQGNSRLDCVADHRSTPDPRPDSPRRKNGHAVSNPRIRACSPTSSGPALSSARFTAYPNFTPVRAERTRVLSVVLDRGHQSLRVRKDALLGPASRGSAEPPHSVRAVATGDGKPSPRSPPPAEAAQPATSLRYVTSSDGRTDI